MKIEIDASEIRTIDRLRDNYYYELMIESMKKYQEEIDNIFYKDFWVSLIQPFNFPDKEQTYVPDSANPEVQQ